MKLPLQLALFSSLPQWAAGVTFEQGRQQPLAKPSTFAQQTSVSGLVDLHKALVEQSSITGTEWDATEFLREYLQDKGFTVYAQYLEEGQQNILAYLGSTRETRILVTSHIDTVPPFLPYERRGDELWGRGSVDAKGSVAAQIIAVEELIAAGSIGEGDVALLFVIGEEGSVRGMADVNDLGLSWEAVVFGEPTELKLARGHKGGLGLRLTAHGKAGHSGYPELGKNAIDILVQGLAALQRVELPWSHQFGNTTLNIGLVQGGVASNVIPETASAAGGIRVAAGTVEELQDLITTALAGIEDLEIGFTYGRGPVPIDYDIDGFETYIANYGTDIPWLLGNHKRYLYGPGSILVAHSDHEHLTVSDLETAVEGYKTIVTELLQR
ncbi:Zn-dependent exopeptidase [Thozetella sp. PMI_491]|nr:Zn-dependent exopeptidase [Thozetella sp. PMI_491]